MTKLEEVLAAALRAATNVDIPAIIEAAKECCIGGCGQTVGNAPVTRVETAPAEPEKPKRGRKAAEPEAAAVPPEPAKAPEAPAAPVQTAAESPAQPEQTGCNLTGLFEGSGPSRKVVKAVFLSAVEKAPNVQALVALNEMCDCGVPNTADYTEETSGVLRRRLTRWGMALT